jgi:hypothetical protein
MRAASVSDDAHKACRNCGETLRGAWCHACGQSGHLHRSLLHLGEEVLHGLLHFEAKGWRTLPLLVARPGLLTRRYIDGQRVRYVSPLALFLFTVFLMFFVVSFGPKGTPDRLAGAASERADLLAEVKDADAAVAKAEQELARIRAQGADITDALAELAEARQDARTQGAALQAFDASPRAAAAPASSPVDGQRRTRVDTGNAKLDAAIRHAIDNPELALYKLKGTAYKFSFLLVPISLPFLWLMFFWRRGIAMYDHAVFSLYSLTFMSLLVTVAALLYGTPARGFVAPLLILVPPVHLAVHLRETHGLTWSSTVWRTGALLCVCLAALLLFLAAILALSMA